MELKRSWSLKKSLSVVFFAILTAYLLIGLTPARAVDVEIATYIKIPEIGLSADVTLLTMRQGILNTPEEIVGSYSRAKNKTFLVGHASNVFKNLDKLNFGDEIDYDLVKYKIVDIKTIRKSDVSMDALLAPADVDTIILMTCAGKISDNGDASHRLIITATAK